jgi:tetratricopeptide (TPR) repeat protein
VAANKARIPGLGLTAEPEVLNNLGFGYLKIGRQSKGEVALERTLALDPGRWSAHLNLGDLYAEGLYLDSARSAKAIEHYSKVLTLKPDYRHAAELRKKMDDLKKGRGKFPDKRSQGTYLFRIRPDLPVYRLVAKKDKFGLATAFQVWAGNGARPIQTIQVDEVGEDCEPTVDKETLVSEDYNFDGYADLALSCFRGATGNQLDLLWLFSPASETFRPAEPRQIFNDPEPDQEDKRLRTHWNGGAMGMTHDNEWYAFENGKFVLVEDESQKEGEEHGIFIKVVRKRAANGEMKEVRRERVEIDE